MKRKSARLAILIGSLLTTFAISPDAAQGPPSGRGGFGPGVQPELKLVADFDKDGDKRLNAAERRAAREYVESQGLARGGRGRRFGFGGESTAAVEPGPKVARKSVKAYPASVPFYDLAAYRTLFLDFENDDWEKELMAFKDTDVEVPATLEIDGKVYKDVGLHFRGMSSFMGVPEGRKHSINVTMDFVNKEQQVGGYRTLNLLNSHEDPTYLRAVLYLQAAREYIPAAKANFVRVVINGENWGAYANVEQVNKEFLKEWFPTSDGTRWKVPGSPGGRGGLEYWGDSVAQYKRVFEIKTKDDPKAWAALVKLTKVLNETPVEQLEGALAPMLDIDGTLKFLALDNALANNDGYWVRASDYNIYLDPSGKFHIIPHDTNETFGPAGRGMGPGGPRGFGGPGGPGRPGGPGGFPPPPPPPGGFSGRGMMGGGATLDPLIGLDDTSKPLRSKLLAVPALRAKYLTYTREIATKWLDWKTLEPLVKQYQALIAADVQADPHKLDSFEAFESGVTTLKNFADTRRAYLLNYK